MKRVGTGSDELSVAGAGDIVSLAGVPAVHSYCLLLFVPIRLPIAGKRQHWH